MVGKDDLAPTLRSGLRFILVVAVDFHLHVRGYFRAPNC